MIDVLKLWASYKENEKAISKIKAKNESIENEILTLFSDAWEKKHGCRTPKGTFSKLNLMIIPPLCFMDGVLRMGKMP